MAIAQKRAQVLNPFSLPLAITLSLLLGISSAKVFFEERFDGNIYTLFNKLVASPIMLVLFQFHSHFAFIDAILWFMLMIGAWLMCFIDLNVLMEGMSLWFTY